MSEVLRSVANARVKSAVKLRDRRGRDRQGRFLIEGYRELLRAAEVCFPLDELFICPQLYLGENEGALVARAAAECGARVVEVTAPVFAKLAYRDRPEGLLATAPIPDWSLARWGEHLARTPDAAYPAPLYLVAVAIEKPGNLGTMLRTADAVGAAGVVVCDRCTDVFNPNVVRASVGTLFTVPVACAASDELLPWLARRAIAVLATTPAAEEVYSDLDLTGPLAIAVGSEQLGLPERWLAATDLRARIPMAGRADSLNAAVATAVVMFETARQRRGRQRGPGGGK